MCSVADDDDDEELHVQGAAAAKCDEVDILESQIQETKIKNEQIECSKCGGTAVIILRVRDSYCVTCLQASVGHKFRSSLGKSHLMRAGEKVLIAVSGGPSSVSMLHLTKQGLDETSHKRLRIVPTVVYIDESAALNVESDDDRKRSLHEMTSLICSYGFPYRVTSIEKTMAPNSSELRGEMSASTEEDREPRLRQLFDSIQSLTSKEDLLVKLRQRLLCEIARDSGCSKVFLGDSETRIAVRVLSDIAQGKGRHLSQACGFVDDRYTDVLFVRPMREILLKEIAYYVKSQGLVTVTRPTFTTKHDSSGSIQHVTEKFVYGLQTDFPSTVTTIFRTADKLTKKKPTEASDNSNTCILCAATIDVVVVVDENRSIRPESAPIVDCSSCSCSKTEVPSPVSNQLDKIDLLPMLCYACRILVNDMPQIDVLPRGLLESATARLRRFKMKSQIQDYLLNDDA